MPKQQWQPLANGKYADKYGDTEIEVSDRLLAFRREDSEMVSIFSDDIRLCQLVDVDTPQPMEMPDEVMKAAHQMLDALKMAYRKHHLEDTAVGWNELSSVMQDALCEAMGDESFIAWLDGLAKE